MAKHIGRDEYFDVRMFIRQGAKNFFHKMADGTSRYVEGYNDEKLAEMLRDKIPNVKAFDVTRARRKEGHNLHTGGKRDATNGVTEERLKKLEGRVSRLLQITGITEDRLANAAKRLDAIEDALTRADFAGRPQPQEQANGPATFTKQGDFDKYLDTVVAR
jgi:hypothetical protein